jgi:hypothetical protein
MSDFHKQSKPLAQVTYKAHSGQINIITSTTTKREAIRPNVCNVVPICIPLPYSYVSVRLCILDFHSPIISSALDSASLEGTMISGATNFVRSIP